MGRIGISNPPNVSVPVAGIESDLVDRMPGLDWYDAQRIGMNIHHGGEIAGKILSSNLDDGLAATDRAQAAGDPVAGADSIDI